MLTLAASVTAVPSSHKKAAPETAAMKQQSLHKTWSSGLMGQCLDRRIVEGLVPGPLTPTISKTRCGWKLGPIAFLRLTESCNTKYFFPVTTLALWIFILPSLPKSAGSNCVGQGSVCFWELSWILRRSLHLHPRWPSHVVNWV